MVAQSIFWLTLPAVVYGLLASLVLRDGSPPRWRSRAARWLQRLRPQRLNRSPEGHTATEDPGAADGRHATGDHDDDQHATGRRHSAGAQQTTSPRHSSGGRGTAEVRSARARREPVDPFDALTVQIRLGVVATQLRTIENDPRIWARARRFQATQHAYDELLAQACLLAGVDVDDDERRPGSYRTEPERFRAEVELAARGWTW